MGKLKGRHHSGPDGDLLSQIKTATGDLNITFHHYTHKEPSFAPLLSQMAEDTATSETMIAQYPYDPFPSCPGTLWRTVLQP